MDNFTEVTSENLKLVRGGKGLTQTAIATLLGIPLTAVSHIEHGKRALSSSEKKLLDLYFFGVMPEGLVRAATDTRASLDLTEDEWRIIQILAARAGQTAEDWIRQRIQDYLAYLEGCAVRDGVVEAKNVEPFPQDEDPTKKDSADGKPNAATTPPPKTDEEKDAG